MLNVPASTSIFLHCGTTDMRKGRDGLCGIVRGQFTAQPDDGSLFLFVNRKRDRMKILYWDGTGYWVFYKRLEAGTFEVISSDDAHVKIDADQLSMILAGIPLATRKRKRYQRSM